MTVLDGFHLPGLADRDYDGWHTFAAGAHVVRTPMLTAAALHRATLRLRSAHERLRALPADTIVDAIDAVAARLSRAHDPLRTTALAALPPLTGYSPAMTAYVLDRMAADWRAPQLRRLLDAELDRAAHGGDVRVGSPRADHGRARERVAPHPLVVHVFAGNVPGVAVTSLVRALLVRSASLGKTAAGEPLLAPLFAQALAHIEPALGDALAVTYWTGGDEALEHAAWEDADLIVAYGGAEAMAAIRARAPARTTVLDHGPRLSIGFVTAAALASAAAARALADDVALAVATFDQQGCVSPHAIFVEEGDRAERGAAEGGTAEFAALLAEALARVETRLPRGALTPGEAAAIREVRSRAEFGALAGRDVALVSPPDAPFTVVLHGTTAFEPSCLQRTIHVHRTPSIAAALDALRPMRASLQSAAVAGDNSAHLDALAAAGFTRITTFARLPWPDPSAPHDGRGPLRELLRIVAVESE